MRNAFPKIVMDIMDKDERVVVLLGDIGVHAFRDVFAKYPTRCYNTGICEQSMVGVAAGLAMAGFIPIVHTISPFLVARAYEQIRDDFGFQELNGTFVGVDVSGNNYGPTHECPEDLSLMSYVKGMTVYAPENAEQFTELLESQYGKLNYFRIK